MVKCNIGRCQSIAYKYTLHQKVTILSSYTFKAEGVWFYNKCSEYSAKKDYNEQVKIDTKFK